MRFRHVTSFIKVGSQNHLQKYLDNTWQYLDKKANSQNYGMEIPIRGEGSRGGERKSAYYDFHFTINFLIFTSNFYMMFQTTIDLDFDCCFCHILGRHLLLLSTILLKSVGMTMNSMVGRLSPLALSHWDTVNRPIIFSYVQSYHNIS